MINTIISVPIGIVSVIWQYDDDEKIKTAFYEFSIINRNNKLEFLNNYYFLENKVCVKKEHTSTFKCQLDVLKDNNEYIKVLFCSDTLILNKEQLQLLNETITNIQPKYNFEFKYSNNINK